MLSTLRFALVPLLALPAFAQSDDALSEREAAFSRMLTNARLVGFFTADDAADDELHKDSYLIKTVSKIDDKTWRFEAVIEMGGMSFPFALPLPVEWAGDTPVLSVTDMAFPMVGTYTARVLFYDDQYVGVWTGKEHGGQMFGRVVREEEPSAGDGDEGNGSAGGGPGARVEDERTTFKAGVDWPSFRGPGALGVADEHPTATEWNVEDGTNIKWRIAVPGLAHSSPVIWGDKLFVTTAIRASGAQELKVGLYGDIAPVEDDSEYTYETHCYDKNSGELRWKRAAWTGVPAIKRHTKGSHAASSPATDGKRVLAWFASEGLYCYDMQGELQWKHDFGVLDSGYYQVKDAQWGFSTSPVLFDDRVIAQVDIQEGSFVAVLDAKTGKELWRTAREEVPTWSTPAVDVRDGRAQVICNGYKHIGGYDLSTGDELWKLEGAFDIPVPTPVVSHDTIFITGSHGSPPQIYAIDVNAKGTLTLDPEANEHLRWMHPNRGTYMQTPIVYGDEVYFCTDAGILNCFDVATGEEIFRERLGSGSTGFTSSGVAADGKLYFASEEGDVHVVLAGFFEELAVNALGEECMASPAISEGVMFYRTRGHLVAIAD